MGGGMQGVLGSAQMAAMEKMGLDKSFKTVVGFSALGATASMFVTRQIETANSIFMEECTTKEFIDLKRVKRVFNRAIRPLLDINLLERTFRSNKKGKM